MADQVRYELEFRETGACIWDRHEQRFTMLTYDHLVGVKNIVIDGVEYELHADAACGWKIAYSRAARGRVFGKYIIFGSFVGFWGA